MKKHGWFKIAAIVALSMVSLGASNTFAAVASSPSCPVLSSIMSPTDYSGILKSIQASSNTKYTYQELCAAVQQHRIFPSSGNKINNILNLAAILANTAHETGRYKYTTEQACTQPDGIPMASAYENCKSHYGAVPGSTDPAGVYYGRGALQLSHDYNYTAYFKSIGQVSMTPPNYVLNHLFDSAMWFWSTSIGQTKTTPEQGFQEFTDVATYTKQDPFGHSIKVVNGGIECYPGATAGSQGAQEAQDRIQLYKQIVLLLGRMNKTNLVSYVSSSANVGKTCTAAPPAPPPTPAKPNQLKILYNGSWSTVSCYYPTNWVSSNLVAVKKNATTATVVPGSEKGGSAYCHPPIPSKPGQTTTVTVTVTVTFTYSSSGWTTDQQGATCSKSGEAYQCTLNDGQ